MSKRNMCRIEHLEGRTLMSTYVVTSNVDGPGVIKPYFFGINLATTLRGAINAANAKPDADVIFMSPALAGTMTLTGGELAITNPLTIQGFGANRQTISAAGASRVFSIASGATVTINDLTIADGSANGAGGGAIRNLGTLTLRDSTVRDSNVIDADGGGVFSNGALTVIDCTFINNHADTGAGGALLSAGANATLINSTFTGNNADFGGAIYNADPHVMWIINCTVSGNHANTSGGGVAGPINDPLTTPPGTKFSNSIIAGNSFGPSAGLGPDLYGFFDSSSARNLIGNIGFAKGIDATKNIVGGIEDATPVVNAKLAALGYYGGTVQSMPPLPGSPAIDAGDNTLVPAGITTDTRGFARITHGKVDMGAVETRFSGVFAEPALPAGLPPTNLVINTLTSLGLL